MGSQPAAGLSMRAVKIVHNRPERWRVVHLFKMRHLVRGYIIEDRLRRENEPPGIHERPGRRTRSPSRTRVAQCQPRIGPPKTGGVQIRRPGQFDTRLFFQPNLKLLAPMIGDIGHCDGGSGHLKTFSRSAHQIHRLPCNRNRHSGCDLSRFLVLRQASLDPVLLFRRKAHGFAFTDAMRDCQRDHAIQLGHPQRDATGATVFPQFDTDFRVARKSSGAHIPLNEMKAAKPLTPVRCYGSWRGLSI